jgi:hypothetical protein
MPVDIQASILDFLTPNDVARFSTVSQECRADALWSCMLERIYNRSWVRGGQSRSPASQFSALSSEMRRAEYWREMLAMREVLLLNLSGLMDDY